MTVRQEINSVQFSTFARSLACALGILSPVRTASALKRLNSWPTPKGFALIDQVRLFHLRGDYYLVHDDPAEMKKAEKKGAVEVDSEDKAVMLTAAIYFDARLELTEPQPPVVDMLLAAQGA